jgi:serine/threonine protein kinase
LDVIARVGADVIGALSHLHRHDVVHRDINPTNIVFDASGSAWLIDLSVAAVGQPARGLPDGWEEERVGTIPYTAPEALLNPAAPAHPTLDIYGLGVMLWEMATGTRPFERSVEERVEDFAERLTTTGVPRSADLERRAGAAFADLVSAMLDPSPAMRPEINGVRLL